MKVLTLKQGLLAILILLFSFLAVTEAKAITDTTPPTGTILISNGALAVNSTSVTLNLSATDNSGIVSQMRFSNDSYTWSAWSAYAATKAWTLTTGEGLKTVYTQFKDASGNMSYIVNDMIRLDQTRPTGTITINAGAAVTNATAVTLTLSATDNSGIIYQMRLSNDNVNWSAWVAYAPSPVWGLNAVDGVKTVYVQFSDRAGNVSTTVSDTIRLDQTNPTGTVSVNAGASATNSTAATLNLSASDNSGTVSQLRVSNDNVNWSAWSAYVSTKAWTLLAGEGLKRAYVQFKDEAGNISAIVSDTITLDQTIPVGTVSINAGASATNSAAVMLNLSATDNSGAVSQVRFSSDNSNWSAWSAYAATKAWTLTSAQGLKTVYAQFKDAAGNVSTAVSDTITLDQIVPVGTISINAGAASTNSTAVTLTLSATDNSGAVSQMRLSYDNVGWSAWSAYAATKGATLLPGDGIKTIFAQFRDAAGNISTSASDTIRLDSTKPTGTISINNGAATTNTTAVTFNLTATDNSGAVSQMRFSYDNVGWSAWSAYAATKAWALSPGEGLRIVYVQFRDVAGNISTSVSDTIRLDQTRPTGTVLINNGAASTSSIDVTLSLSATDNSGAVSLMRFSNDNVNWTLWSAYAATKGVTLLSVDGIKTVYVQFADASGNVSTSASDTITLDQTGPVGTISINNGAAATNSPAVTFNLSATDNSGVVSQMRFSYDNVGWSAWSAYATTKAWTLAAGEGVKTVYVQFRDAAGAVSLQVSDTIRLDQTLPVGTISINNGALSTNSTAVTFNLSATDNSGMVSQMRFSNDNANWSAWETYSTVKNWTLVSGAGIKTVYVQFKDAAGNVSATGSDTIDLVVAAVTVGGRVTTNNGTGVSNVLVSLNTTPTPRTAYTDSNGNYAIYNVPAGSYQVTPSVPSANGALFSPAVRSVTVGASNVLGVDFKAKVTYSISGTVNYAGTKTGRVYLATNNDNGTSIASPGAFTIRGVEPGQFTLHALLDHIGDGRAHATSPTGSVVVTVGISNVTGVNITLTDPAPYVPAPPQLISVSPSSGSAVISWNPPYAPNGKDTSDKVKIYYSTVLSSNPAVWTLIGTFDPMDDNFFYLQKGLVNGSVFYYVMTSEAGGMTSVPSNVIGPVTIGPRGGGSMITGAVTASGFTPTGSLVVGLWNEPTSTYYYTAINSPAASQPYSVTGVPNGAYAFDVVYDMNNNGIFDAGDIHNFDANETVTVTTSQVKNTTVSSVPINGAIRTEHYKDGAYESYSLMFNFERGRKYPVSVAVVSGPNLAGPLDLGADYQARFFKFYGNILNAPLVGDTYTMNVIYSDGTTATVTRAVTGVVNSFPTSLSPSGPVPGATTPTFIWSAPSPAMLNAAGYRIGVYDSNWNSVWWSEQISMTDLSKQFNFDGRANTPALVPGTPYRWNISVEDQFGNMGASINLGFTP